MSDTKNLKKTIIIVSVVIIGIILLLSFQICLTCGISTKYGLTLKGTICQKCDDCLMKEPNPELLEANRQRMSHIETVIVTISINNEAHLELRGIEAMPDSLQQLVDDNCIPKSYLNDAWGTPFQYDKGAEYGFRVRSAGPDREFGTKDDITYYRK